MFSHWQLLNETIVNGSNPQDGLALSNMMWGRTFRILGQKIVINTNGDRDADWLLSQMNPNNDNGPFWVGAPFHVFQGPDPCTRDFF